MARGAAAEKAWLDRGTRTADAAGNTGEVTTIRAYRALPTETGGVATSRSVPEAPARGPDT
ncbi:hypothetical protein ACWEIJ_17795 [Lentzea sp. NPDC004789]